MGTFELTADDYAKLTAHGSALYEARLSQAGKQTSEAHDKTFARMWASACVAEAVCVLECTVGLDEAERMITAMMGANAGYRGPRMKHMRSG